MVPEVPHRGPPRVPRRSRSPPAAVPRAPHHERPGAVLLGIDAPCLMGMIKEELRKTPNKGWPAVAGQLLLRPSRSPQATTARAPHIGGTPRSQKHHQRVPLPPRSRLRYRRFPATTAWPHDRTPSTRDASRRGGAPPGFAPPAGPPRLPVRHEAGNLRDPLAPTSSPPGFPPWAGGARRCAVRAWRDDDGSCVESPLGTQKSARARPAQRWPRSPIVPASLRARRCDPGGRTPGSAPVATAGVDGGGPSAPARGLRMRARCACSTALAGGTWLRTRDDPKWDRRGTRGAGEEASAPRSGTIEEPGPVDGGDGRHNVMAPGPTGRCERVLQWVGASERARRAAAERPRACAGYDARTVEAGSFGCATRGSDP